MRRTPKTEATSPAAPDTSAAGLAVSERPPEPSAPPQQALEERPYFVTFAWHDKRWKYRMTDKAAPGFGRVAYAGEMCQAITVEVKAASEDDAKAEAEARITGITA